jgi:hypothetical protein
MLSDTEDDLPRLEAEMRAKYAEADQLEQRVRRLRQQASDRLRGEFFKFLSKEPPHDPR